MLTFIIWTILVVNVLNAVATVLIIGKPRTPVTSGNAVFTILMSSAMVAACVYALATPTLC